MAFSVADDVDGMLSSVSEISSMLIIVVRARERVLGVVAGAAGCDVAEVCK